MNLEGVDPISIQPQVVKPVSLLVIALRALVDRARSVRSRAFDAVTRTVIEMLVPTKKKKKNRTLSAQEISGWVKKRGGTGWQKRFLRCVLYVFSLSLFLSLPLSSSLTHTHTHTQTHKQSHRLAGNVLSWSLKETSQQPKGAIIVRNSQIVPNKDGRGFAIVPAIAARRRTRFKSRIRRNRRTGSPCFRWQVLWVPRKRSRSRKDRASQKLPNRNSDEVP